MKRPPARGYVLVTVLGTLAVLALLAGRFAQRIDEMRAQVGTLDAQAKASVEAASAAATALFWIATRPSNPAGFGDDPTQTVHADGRAYRLPSGAEIRVQDTRGLLPVNLAVNTHVLRALLIDSGVALQRADQMVDVLLDYADGDSLRRLNGAEDAEYTTLGLAPPRNDWLVSLRELSRLPLWRDDPPLLARLEGLLSTHRDGLFNPNAAPAAVLRARLPAARPEQIELFQTLRRDMGFFSADTARRSTGLAFGGDDQYFFTSATPRVTVWAPGLPRPVQYNLQLTPDGERAPWQLYEVRSAPLTGPPSPPQSATPFPLVIASDRP